MNIHNKGFARVSLLIGLFIALLVLAVWMYGSFKEGAVVMNTESNNVIAISTSTSTAEAIKWKAYRNKSLGFELKYPSKWTVKESADRKSIALWNEKEGLAGIHITATTNPEKLTAREYVHNLVKESHEEKIKTGVGYDLARSESNGTDINSIDAFVIHDVFQFDQSSELIFATNGKYMFEFMFPVNKPNPNLNNPEKNYDMVLQILQTLTFTENTMEENTISLLDAVKNVKVGDIIGGFAVTKVEPTKIYTSGEVKVIGKYEDESEIFGPSFNVTLSESEPRIEGDDRNYWFCVSNHKEVEDMLKPYIGQDRIVEVVIKDYIIDLKQSEVCDSAKIVSVVER